MVILFIFWLDSKWLGWLGSAKNMLGQVSLRSWIDLPSACLKISGLDSPQHYSKANSGQPRL